MEDQEESVRSRGSKGCSKERWEMIYEEYLKPYMYCIFCNFCTGVNIVLTKVSLNHGMSRYVLVVYAHAIRALTTAVLAFLFERNNKSKTSILILLDIFLLGLVGSVPGRTLFLAGLEYTTPAFASVMINLVPSFTFILAVLCSMEKLEISRHSAQAKIVGSIVSFGGAVLLTLYKGVIVVSFRKHSHLPRNNKRKEDLDRDWIKGSIFLFISCFSLALFYILQASAIKKYPAPITLTLLTCLSGTLLATIMTAILDHKASSWILSWNIALLGPVFAVILSSGLGFYVQALVVSKRGPVFTTAFRPLSIIIAALMGLFIFGDALHLGGVLGATLIFLGLYVLLWGKEKEREENK